MTKDDFKELVDAVKEDIKGFKDTAKDGMKEAGKGGNEAMDKFREDMKAQFGSFSKGDDTDDEDEEPKRMEEKPESKPEKEDDDHHDDDGHSHRLLQVDDGFDQ